MTACRYIPGPYVPPCKGMVYRDGLCARHFNEHCRHCGSVPATHDCEYYGGAFACGCALCDGCTWEHTPDGFHRHVTKASAA